MLTIAIPTYNYNAFPLVERVHFLCSKATISFEILCYDDGSTQPETIEANQKINSLPYSKYIFGNPNKGLSFARNWLLSNAIYESILLLDTDMMPEQEDFIQKYLPFLNSEYLIVFGGISYKNNTDYSKQLRYIYGITREALSVEKRRNNPFQLLLYSNTLLSKKILPLVKFDENLKTYGYEDSVFTKKCKDLNLKVTHINNRAIHNHEDSSANYICKVENSLKNLLILQQKDILNPSESSILKAFHFLKTYYLTNLYVFFYTSFKSVFYKNLTSNKPNLFIFDLYKLGYFIQLTKEDF